MEKENIIQNALLEIHRNELAVTKIQEVVHTLQTTNEALRHALLTLRNDEV